MARKHLSRDQWQQIIDDQAASGLKIVEYCRQHEYSPSSFYQWKSQLKPKSVTSAPDDTPLFVPIDADTGTTAPADQSLSLELSLGNWFRLSWKR